MHTFMEGAVTETAEIRERMIEAGQSLFAQRGYSVTLLDVMKAAGTPRGSIYYHLPQGKHELAVAVARKMAGDMERVVAYLSGRHDDPVEFAEALVSYHTKRLIESGYQEGCPILGITVSQETSSEELSEAVADSFRRWIQAIARNLRDKGMGSRESQDVAATIVSAIEGALVVSRALQSRRPMDQLRGQISSLVAARLC
jgi:TetR/AcrR family transcriptional repressor of lmrAB and yxaGH operons